MPVLRHVYDPTSGTYHDVEVTQEVYDFYRRNHWAIRRSNTRFYAHEIQFSSLKGGTDGAFERFDEFLSQSLDPQNIFCEDSEATRIADAFHQLPPADQHLLYYLIIEGRSERWYGGRMGWPQKTVHNRKHRALKRFWNRVRAN